MPDLGLAGDYLWLLLKDDWVLSDSSRFPREAGDSSFFGLSVLKSELLFFPF